MYRSVSSGPPKAQQVTIFGGTRTTRLVAVSPGVGFGPGGEGFVRFALVENEQRITQAVRGIKRALTKLG